MDNFNPPFDERDSWELVMISHQLGDYWPTKTREQAERILKKRNVSYEEQLAIKQELLAEWAKEDAELDILIVEQRKRNRQVSYKYWEIIAITAFAPFILFRPMWGNNIWDLYRENYMKKFWQRIACFIVGVTVWFLMIYNGLL